MICAEDKQIDEGFSEEENGGDEYNCEDEEDH